MSIKSFTHMRLLGILGVFFLLGVIGCAEPECQGYCETACAKASICYAVLDDVNMSACVDECVRVLIKHK